MSEWTLDLLSLTESKLHGRTTAPPPAGGSPMLRLPFRLHVFNSDCFDELNWNLKWNFKLLQILFRVLRAGDIWFGAP